MIEDLRIRTARWSVATGEILDAMLQVHGTLRALGVQDEDGSALVMLVSLIADRAQPPEVVLGEGDDEGGEPAPQPLQPVET